MIVKNLIAKLQEMDPNSQVLVEGAADTFWSVRDTSEDENGVAAVLFVGSEVTVKCDDSSGGVEARVIATHALQDGHTVAAPDGSAER